MGRLGVAIYAPPAEQERALRELLKHDLDPENIGLTDNLKSSSEPLFRRKYASGIESRSQSTFQPQAEARDYEECDEPLQPEGSSANLDEGVNRNHHTTDSNDALDGEPNNQSESTRMNCVEKGKSEADVTDLCWQPTSACQAATHESGPIPVQTSLQTEGSQELVHSFGMPEITTMCQYPDFFNASIATGQQAPFQIHQPCDSYANTAAHPIGYQANSGYSYNPQDTSMGFAPVNGARPAIILSGQQDDFEMSFGSNGALQAAQPSMPSTWSTSGNLNATFFETGSQYVKTDGAPTWQSPLGLHVANAVAITMCHASTASTTDQLLSNTTDI
ncbi:hypothetical protein ACEPAG_2720 [Sanghuangporus baumii]